MGESLILKTWKGFRISCYNYASSHLLLFLMSDNKKIMVWNVQGAGSKGFMRVFKNFCRKYSFDIIGILEPRISGVKAYLFIKNSGYFYSHRVEAVGFSGGIWIIWNQKYDIVVLDNNKYFIHLRIVDGTETFLLTIVYASPNATLRQHLWTDLNVLATLIAEPWMLGGNFNAALYDNERKGGAYGNGGGCRQFRSFFESHSLIDLGFCGSQFTWKRGTLFKRLDIFICNDRWTSKFNYFYVLHLPRIQSDHNPIFIQFNKQHHLSSGPKPFRFQAAWIGNDGFKDLVRQSWNNASSLADSIENFAVQAKRWNTTVFGNIFKRKDNLLSRLYGIQKAREFYYSDKLNVLEDELKKELDTTFYQEELLWIQKSRNDWVIDGDCNTNYFHNKVKD
ncbi:uncharacterized protein LOC126670515 [Mercurialis annua]|uniref:uncharacterized protein LOC126670515 n=1 Tax=Mercurialis annua TaxID=3986 RepID=UPI002160ECCA|nr:uncharacterized protein LOC126670515 [Mercurialis annua]